MGKKLIIKGADFSINGIESDKNVTPSNYWAKGYSTATKVISTSGAAQFAIFKVAVSIGKTYRIYACASHYQNIWEISAEAAENFSIDITPAVPIGSFPDPTEGIVTYKDVTISKNPYLIFTSKVCSDKTKLDVEDLLPLVKVYEFVEN